MNDLITVKEKDGREFVDARELHAALGVKTEFKDWIARRVEAYGFIDGKDFRSELSESTGGRPSKEYSITVSMAKELAAVENNDKGREVRRYLIQVEEAWNTPEMVVARGLQAAIAMQDALRARLAAVQPALEAHAALMVSEKTMSITDAAKHFGLHPKAEVFPYLRERGYLTEEDLPSQRAIDAGYLVIRETKCAGDVIRKQAVVEVSQLDTWRLRVVPQIKKWKGEGAA